MITERPDLFPRRLSESITFKHIQDTSFAIVSSQFKIRSHVGNLMLRIVDDVVRIRQAFSTADWPKFKSSVGKLDTLDLSE